MQEKSSEECGKCRGMILLEVAMECNEDSGLFLISYLSLSASFGKPLSLVRVTMEIQQIAVNVFVYNQLLLTRLHFKHNFS